MSSNLTPTVSFFWRGKICSTEIINPSFLVTRLFFHFSFKSESKWRRRLVRYFVQVPHLSGSTTTHSRILPKRHKLTWIPRNLIVYRYSYFFRFKRHLLYAELNRRWNGAHIFLTCSDVFYSIEILILHSSLRKCYFIRLFKRPLFMLKSLTTPV